MNVVKFCGCKNFLIYNSIKLNQWRDYVHYHYPSASKMELWLKLWLGWMYFSVLIFNYNLSSKKLDSTSLLMAINLAFYCKEKSDNLLADSFYRWVHVFIVIGTSFVKTKNSIAFNHFSSMFQTYRHVQTTPEGPQFLFMP